MIIVSNITPKSSGTSVPLASLLIMSTINVLTFKKINKVDEYVDKQMKQWKKDQEKNRHRV